MVAVKIKYVCFVMRADNDGERGIIALFGSRLRGRDRPNYGPLGPRLERLLMPQSRPSRRGPKSAGVGLEAVIS